MVSDVLQLAKQRREKLRADRQVIDDELARIDEFIRQGEQLQMALSMNADFVWKAKAGMQVVEAKTVPKKREVLDFCVALVRERGPMGLNDIFAELMSAGINPGSSQPKAMLSIILNRSDEFVSENRLWKLKK